MKFLERALDGQSQAWKYIVTLVVSFIGGSFIGSIPLVAIVMYKSMVQGITPNFDNLYDLSPYGISMNMGFFLMLLPFVLSMLLLIFFNKLLHKRSYKEIINGTKTIRWSRLVAGAIFWTVLLVVSLIISYALAPDNFVLQFNWSSFIPLLLITIVMIPIQTSYEEMAFRGYFAQGVAAWTRSRWWALIIPSVVFGLLHSFNPEVAEYGFGWMMPQYILFGVIFGLISILDDGIELALGVHMANNAFLSLFITSSSSALRTPAVFNQLYVDPRGGLFELLVFGILLIAFFYKKYNWSFSIMNKRVEKNPNDNMA